MISGLLKGLFFIKLLCVVNLISFFLQLPLLLQAVKLRA